MDPSASAASLVAQRVQRIASVVEISGTKIRIALPDVVLELGRFDRIKDWRVRSARLHASCALRALADDGSLALPPRAI